MFNHTLKTLDTQLRLLQQDAGTAAHIQQHLNTRPDQAGSALRAVRLHLSGAINAEQLRGMVNRPANRRRPTANYELWLAASDHAQRVAANRRNR